tara:strand:- start:109 stop:1104 length:996 start_codon:yes stop_codon:yes gene_type:complete
MGLNEKFFKSEEGGGGTTSFFNTVLYTGNGSVNARTGVGFKPDLVWIKGRAGSHHTVYDSIRGVNKALRTNLANAEFVGTGFLTSFDVDGFTLGGNEPNNSSGNTVAWCFKAGGAAVTTTPSGGLASTVSANVGAGFSMVKFRSDSSAGLKIAHGLSSAPEMIIYKLYDASQGWYVNTNQVNGNRSEGVLNTNAGFSNVGSAWSSMSTSTLINSFTSSNGQDYMAYCFHSVAGVSKVGSYTGTGNNMTVNVGFEPAFIIIKNTTDAASWHIFDNKRTAANPSTEALFPNETSGSADYNNVFEFTSTGFNNKVTSTYLNKPSSVYLYYAVSV